MSDVVLLYGVRASDHLRVRLGRFSSRAAAENSAYHLMRQTQLWSHCLLYNAKGQMVQRINKPPVEGSGRGL